MRKLYIPLVALFAISSCTQDDCNVTPSTKELNLNVPASEVDLPTLGRVLFYDTRLSENNMIACASCHKQNLGFGDDVAFSTGFQGKKTLRNSISINELGSSGFVSTRPLFWDGREESLNEMVILPMLNHVEMGMSDKDAVVTRVQNAGYYRELFSQVFGGTEITIDEISTALESFVTSIQSNNSKLDLVNRGQANFTMLEQQGSDLFFNVYPCGSCHSPQTPYNNTISTSSFIDIGMDLTPTDQGRAGVTGTSTDVGKFRIPSLNNVVLGAPYMHDGRFNTLDEVIEHYSTGIKDVPNLDPRLRDANGNPLLLNITTEQKRALIAFLNTLTDFQSLNAEKLSDPFKR